MAFSKSSKDAKYYYILIKYMKDEPNLSIGTLWILEQKLTRDLILVTKYEGDNVGILKQIRTSFVKEILYQEAHLLLGIPDPLSNRVKVIMDPVWIKEGLEISVGTMVRIFDFPGLENGAIGTVQFKGRLPGKNGTSFGIELSQEHARKGTTDGTFRHKKLFTCDEDCGVFLSILKIRKAYSEKSNDSKIDIGTRSAAEGIISNKNFSDQIPISNQNFSNRIPDQDLARTDSDCTLHINEKVVWMSDEGAEFGTVKWIGILPHSIDNKTVVGVEFDNAVGTGTGKYKGTQLFKAKRNHASLIPMLGLLKASDYLSSMSSSSGIVTDYKDSNSIEYQDIKIGGVTTKGNFESNNDRGKSVHGKASASNLEDNLYNLKMDDLPHQRAYEQADGLSSKDIQPSYTNRSPKDVQSHTSNTEKIAIDSHRGARPKVFSNQSTEIHNEDYSRGNRNKITDSPNIIKQKRYETMGEYEQQFFEVKVGTRVLVTLGSDRYGIVRWIGTFPDSKTPDRIVAGIEMDIEDENCYTDGRFLGERVFECSSKKGLFYPLNKCVPIMR